MMEFAYGIMGLTPEQFAGLTPFVFNQKCEGFAKGREMEAENFRQLGFIVYKMNVDSKDTKTKDDIWPNSESVKRKKERNKQIEKSRKRLVDVYKKRKGLK